MSRKVVTVAGVPANPNPVSPAVAVGGFLFVSGQTAREQQGVEAQTRAVLEKIGAILRAGGSDYAKVARCNVYPEGRRRLPEDERRLPRVLPLGLPGAVDDRRAARASRRPRGDRLPGDSLLGLGHRIRPCRNRMRPGVAGSL